MTEGNKIKVIVAVISLIGILVTALITNWDKFFPAKPTTENNSSSKKDINSVTPPEKAPDLKQAEKLISDWIAAMLAKDIDKLVKLADTPFYFDNEIIVSREDIRRRYQKIFSDPREQNDSEGIQLQKLSVKTIKDLRDEGYDERRDRILSSLRLNEDDYIGLCVFGKIGQTNQEGMIIVVRKVDNNLKVAGFWN